MPKGQKRVYVSDQNHENISGLLSALKENKTVQSMNIRIDQNFAFSVLWANAKVSYSDPEMIEQAVQNFLEMQNRDRDTKRD
jgi:hypothetical protein